jgi:chromosome segregation and condensation protein ScpB
MRNLLSRGLVERVGNPLDGREYIYRPTTELLAHLGVGENKELPDFEKISAELKGFEKQKNAFMSDDDNAA